jgi:hypothetical protein
MVKRKRIKGKTMIYNALHRTLKISLNIPSGKESEDLPYLYWIPRKILISGYPKDL